MTGNGERAMEQERDVNDLAPPARPLPPALVVVAVLFIVGGCFAIIEILVGLAHAHLNLNFAVLGLFVGPGLPQLRRGWRTCGLVLVWIGLILVPLVALLFLMHGGPLDFNVFGRPVGHVPVLVGLLVAGGIFALNLWIYHVLTRADVRALFGLS